MMNDATRRLVLRLKGPLESPVGAPPDSEEKARSLRLATESVLTLPTLPLVANRMLQMVDDPGVSADRMSNALGEDQVLTARILKLANSSYYGYPRKIGTVRLAILVLGFDAIKDLVLSVSVMDMFRAGETGGLFDPAACWDHSLRVAAASRSLARILRWRGVGEAFTAGILHDIGKVVLHQYHARQFDDMIRHAKESGIDPQEAELEVLGATHAEVGGWLAAKWNLPEALVQAIRFHHSPGEAGDTGAAHAALLHVADVVVHRLGYSSGTSGFQRPEVHPDAFRILSAEGLLLGAEDLVELESSLAQDVEKIEGLRVAYR